MSKDTIYRQDAIDVIYAIFPVDSMKSEYAQGIACGAALAKTYVEQLPSAQPERKTGKWILVKGSNGKDYHKCSECLHTQEITGVKNYCAVCGADMREGQDETD